MKQRIWLAIFALIFVASCVKSNHKARGREPIVLTEGGFMVDGKELRFGMSEAEVFALLGAPTDSTPDDISIGMHWYGFQFMLRFRDDVRLQDSPRYLTSISLYSSRMRTMELGGVTFATSESYAQAIERLSDISIAGATIEHTEKQSIWRKEGDSLTIRRSREHADKIESIEYRNETLPLLPPIAIELLPDGVRIDEKEVRFGMSQTEVMALLGEPMHIFDDAGKSASYTYAAPPVSLNFDRQLGEEFLLGSLRLLAPPRRGVTFLLLGEEFSLKDDWQAIQARLKAIDDPAFALDTKAPLWFTASWHDVTLTLPSSDVIMMHYRWQE
ncbi:hypothetical protein [Entomospira culicis]|uniref:Lipoprotein n=1 Tax=Entomospira culicis TaxID=2719989 RepID=A0A968GH90_9SPIO|nr:hypothetical protein [Entomospira culicis]NIZ19849.1 hypothetical protein [Entomospira culicis]NIZ70063.1 hypothetical protein [Entomospira culicis]WDI37167.1 hypothetical protein PVA46_07560 [Entomospira culicis]WDI38796.1 hypothetical protein PVA47_07570 [Entomospira culicis]